MDGSRVATLEQAPVVEEHVHELPQQVVGGLDQLLAHERVLARRVELPLGARGVEGHREAAAFAGQRHGGRGAGAEGDGDVAGLGRQLGLAEQVAALRGQPDRRERALPTITGCTNSTAMCRTSERAAGEIPSAISRPPRAKRSAIRWQSRARRSASAGNHSAFAAVRAASAAS